MGGTALRRLKRGACYEMCICTVAAMCQGRAWERPQTLHLGRWGICLSRGSVRCDVGDDGRVLVRVLAESMCVHARLLG